MKNKQQFIKQFISYLFVGGGATIVEWVGFWLFDHCLHIQYLIATAFAFFFSTFANWLFATGIVFFYNFLVRKFIIYKNNES